METLQIADGQAFNVLVSRMPRWSGWLASIVVDQQGNYVGTDGTSKSISNELDLQLLLALRSNCSVIVTTGATARAESYKASRFAPIAFITKSQNSLKVIPALVTGGQHSNIFLESNSDELDFFEIGNQLRGLGYQSFLFEGGPSTLKQLLSCHEEVQLVLSVTDGDNEDLAAPKDFDPVRALPKGLVTANSLELKDDFQADQNRISRWLKAAS